MNYLNNIISNWKYNFKHKIWLSLRSCFEGLGILWFITEVISYFSSSFDIFIKSNWYLYLIVLPWIIYKSWPKLKFSHRLADREVLIELCINNMFKLRGSYVISSNTTFDTKMSNNANAIISDKSTQGQFTKKYYDKVDHLDNDIFSQLRNIESQDLDNRINGKNKRYPMGTVIKVNPKNQIAYLVAIADINEYGSAIGTFDNLRDGLSSLWNYIGKRGNMAPVIMPVIGSGFTRLTNKREEIIHEIIKSFIAANGENKITEKLVIVIYPRDYKEHKLDIYRLHKYLAHYCEYTQYKDKKDTGLGQPVP